MKREASKTPLIQKYLKQNKIYCNWEVKQTRTNSLRFSAVSPHQIESLLAGEIDGMQVKLSDADPRIKPCDGSNIPPQIGYIIILYTKTFVLIPVKTFVREKEVSREKSLTFERACEIADKIVHI